MEVAQVFGAVFLMAVSAGLMLSFPEFKTKPRYQMLTMIAALMIGVPPTIRIMLAVLFGV